MARSPTFPRDERVEPLATIVAVGALSLILTLGDPSLPLLSLFLITVALVGRQYAAFLSDSPIVRIGLAFPIGVAIVTLGLLFQFATSSPELILLSARVSVTATLFVASFVAASLHIRWGGRMEAAPTTAQEERRLGSRIGYVLILAVFVLALAIRLEAQAANTSAILPDAALFFSAARSLAQNGTFSANVLNDVPGASPYIYTQGGLIPHTGTWLLLGSFFSFGGVSFEVDKIMLVVLGSILVFPICLLVSEWYGRKLAWLAGLVIAVQPAFLFFSVVPFGPEIISVTLAFSGIAILEVSRRLEVSRYSATILSGLLLGVSCITWDPRLVMVYLMGYALSLLIAYRVTTPWVWALIAATAGLGLNMFLTSASIVNPPLLVAVLPVAAALAWRKHRQLSSFLWVNAIVGMVYGLWVARWYLNPQFAIYGTAAQTSTALQGSLQAASTAGLESSADTYVQLLRLASLTFVILLAFMSAVFVPKSLRRSSFALFYILTGFGVAVLFYPSGFGFFLGYTATRLLLGTAVAFVLLGSGALIGIFDEILAGLKRSGPWVRRRKEPLRGASFGRTSSSVALAYVVVLVLLVLLVTVAIYQEFSSGYDQYSDFANEVNYPSIMGLASSVPWIARNTPINSRFLVTSGNTGRLWAMALGNRSFAALAIVLKNGTVAPYSDIGLSDVVEASTQVGAGYVVMDPIMLTFPPNNLTTFYERIAASDTNTTFAALPSTAGLETVLDSRNLGALRVAYVSNDTAGRKVVVLQPIAGPMHSAWTDDFTTSSGEWTVESNGSLASGSGELSLTPGAASQDVYALHTFQEDLEVTSSTFVILRSQQSASSYSGYDLQFESGKSAPMIFTGGGLHAISLAKYAGERIQSMLLYDLPGNTSRGSPTPSRTVSYNFVVIGDLTGQ